MSYPDTTNCFDQSFLQAYVNKVRARVMAAGMEFPQGGLYGNNSLAYKVSATMSDGETACCDPVAFTNPYPASPNAYLPLPIADRINHYGAGYGVNLSWDAVSDAKGYSLYFSRNDAGYTVLARTSAGVTTFTDNSTNLPYSGPQNTDAKAGQSTTAAPSGLTATATDEGTADLSVQLGDNVGQGASATATSFVTYESGHPPYYTHVAQPLTPGTIGGLQLWLTVAMANYLDPTASVADSGNTPLLSKPSGSSEYATVIENIIGSRLWRRRRPRMIPDLTLTYADYGDVTFGSGAYSYGNANSSAASEGMRALYYNPSILAYPSFGGGPVQHFAGVAGYHSGAWSVIGAATVSTLTASGSTATVTTSDAHRLKTGDWVTVAGQDQGGYTVRIPITVTGDTTFTYPVASGLTSPATGSTITATPAYLKVDVMDSENDPGGGDDCAAGIMQPGDYIGPWLFDQLDAVLAKMTRTTNSNFYIVKYDQTWPADFSDYSSILGGQNGAGVSTVDDTAADAVNSAQVAAAASLATTGPAANTTILAQSPAGHTPAYSADVNLSRWKWWQDSIWQGAAATVNLLVWGSAPTGIVPGPGGTMWGTADFDGGDGSITDATPSTPGSTPVWNIFDSVSSGGGGGVNSYDKALGTKTYNSDLTAPPYTYFIGTDSNPDDTPVSYYGAGINFGGFMCVVDWTFDE